MSKKQLSNQSNKKMTRRSFLETAATAGLAALALSGCNSNSKTTAETDATTIRFVLDYSPNVNHTGLYVALQKGWFKEANIDLVIVPVPADGSDALIGSGGADMGVTYQDYIANSLSSANPMPYQAIAAIVQHNTSGIISRAEDGITSAKAMEGHTYATWNLPVEQATIKQVVETDGGDFSKVQMVPYEVDDEVAGLRANLFDSVWCYEWWAVQNAKLQDYPVNYFSFADMDPVFDYYTPVIAANDSFIAEHADVAATFLRIVKQGYEFAANNPAEAAQMLCDAVPELDPALIQAAQESISPEYIADATSWGTIDSQRWARFYQWLNDEGLVEHTFDVNAGYRLDILELAEQVDA